ncbi:MAG: DUF5615 family PIN-like protein [Actinomycetota bacterium]
MKLLVDAQLPVRLADALRAAGHDVVHTSEFIDGNRTTDAEVTRIADGEQRVVVSKDRDFRDSHLLGRGPSALLVVATGNIGNSELLSLMLGSFSKIEAEPAWS